MNIKSTKGKLLMSAVSLLVCMSMLVTSTFAWFTDTASSANNIIASGNLDVELYHSSASVTGWENVVDAKDTLFRDAQGEPMLWEPGVVTYENFKIVNEGDLALKYRLAVTTADENYVVDAANPSAKHGLSQVLKVGVVDGGIYPADGATAVTRVDVVSKVTTWQPLATNALYGGDDTLLLPATNSTIADNTADEGTVTAAAQPNEKIVGLVVYWQPSDNDNNFNLNNGKQLSTNVEGATALTISLGIRLDATQAQYESDSFGSDYDAAATFPELPAGPISISADITGKTDANGLLTEDVTLEQEGVAMFALVREGTATTGSTLTLTVDTIDCSRNIEMQRGEASRSFDVHIEGIAEDNTVAATIGLGNVLPTGLKAVNVELYHVENEEANEMYAANTPNEHNEYSYDANTGELIVSMATFSEVTVVAATNDPWDGKYEFKDEHAQWYTNSVNGEYIIDDEDELETFSAIVGGMHPSIAQDEFAGKTVKLGANLDLGGSLGRVWYPIGYYNSTRSYNKVSSGSVTSNVSSFEGTFDGQGYTISNIYQNTWDMFGDYNNGYSGTPNHYKDGMGVFGFVLNGTIKNLTVNNFQSDGEFSTTGCVAAYASGSSTFENITITNSNPRAYNVPNGGVVGYAYAEERQPENKTSFINCTVSSTNKISALWGSWDVACGGLLGRVTDDAKVYISDCDIAAQIDVHNDVCGNYQYYQYRYAGLLIGTVGSDGNPTDQVKDNISIDKTDGKTTYVSYGDWTDYYYCELEANSMASYSDDYQFSRLEKISDVSEIQNGIGEWTKAGNFFLDKNTCYHIVNNNGVLTRHTHTEEENHQRVCIPFKQLGTGYGWGATPIKVLDVTEYAYAIRYYVGEDLIHEAYVSVNDADKGKYAVAITNNKIPLDFKAWINAGGKEIDNIEAGNRKDVNLYATLKDKCNVLWVDEDGNMWKSETVTKGEDYKSKFANVAGPASKYGGMIFDHWEVRNADGTYINVSEENYIITGNITLYPYYVYDTGAGKIGLTPHDTNDDGRADYYTVEAVDGLIGQLVIPGQVNGAPVTAITDLSSDNINGLFSDGITSVEIKDGVQEIGSNAFAMTTKLKEVSVPVSVTKIGSGAFADKFWSNVGSGIGVTNKVVTITFEGNQQQWDAIDFADGWDGGLRTGSVVQCSDGKYVLEVSGGILGWGEKYNWTWIPNN